MSPSPKLTIIYHCPWFSEEYLYLLPIVFPYYLIKISLTLEVQLLSSAFFWCIKAFGLVNLIVERMGDEVKHLAEGLVQLLPRVWSRAEGQSLLRMQVLDSK